MSNFKVLRKGKFKESIFRSNLFEILLEINLELLFLILDDFLMLEILFEFDFSLLFKCLLFN